MRGNRRPGARRCWCAAVAAAAPGAAAAAGGVAAGGAACRSCVVQHLPAGSAAQRAKQRRRTGNKDRSVLDDTHQLASCPLSQAAGRSGDRRTSSQSRKNRLLLQTRLHVLSPPCRRWSVVSRRSMHISTSVGTAAHQFRKGANRKTPSSQVCATAPSQAAGGGGQCTKRKKLSSAATLDIYGKKKRRHGSATRLRCALLKRVFARDAGGALMAPVPAVVGCGGGSGCARTCENPPQRLRHEPSGLASVVRDNHPAWRRPQQQQPPYERAAAVRGIPPVRAAERGAVAVGAERREHPLAQPAVPRAEPPDRRRRLLRGCPARDSLWVDDGVHPLQLPLELHWTKPDRKRARTIW